MVNWYLRAARWAAFFYWVVHWKFTMEEYEKRGRELGEQLGNTSFPHEDCRYLRAKYPDETKNLVSNVHDFNRMYDSLSYLFWRTRDFPLSTLKDFFWWVELSFFERFEYSDQIRKAITLGTTPVLFTRLKLYEELRPLLARKLKEMMKEKTESKVSD